MDVQLITDEADAALAILGKRRANQAIAEADWERLFSSEGYVRLKKQEAEMGTFFQDTDFRAFVLSEKILERATALEKALTRWRHTDVADITQRALAYLPEGTRTRAKIYPVIKPKENSFVFELETDPAIFLYIDSKKTEAQWENTLAHELHHIGYASSCPSEQIARELSELPWNAQMAIECTTAFGEGFAMLAAAGGPDVHPHAVSDPENQARWDRDMENFDQDLRSLEAFLLDVLKNRLETEAEIRKVGFSFFGIQGPWYTVGWKMAVTIERTYGRAKLIECLCDPRKLLSTYNEAAREYNHSTGDKLALWSPSLVAGICKPHGSH